MLGFGRRRTKMDNEKLILLGLLILLGIVVGVFIGYNIHSPSQITTVRTDTLSIPHQSSTGTSTKTKFIHDTTWIKGDTVRITNPDCMPYETMRSDSMVEVYIKSYPLYQFNWDSVYIKTRKILYPDTIKISTTVNGLSWWYLPVVAVETVIIILKLFNVW
jgi:hypothetical protein